MTRRLSESDVIELMCDPAYEQEFAEFIDKVQPDATELYLEYQRMLHRPDAFLYQEEEGFRLPVLDRIPDEVRTEMKRTEKVNKGAEQEWKRRLIELCNKSLSPDLDNTAPTLLRRPDGASLIYPARMHSIAGESECGKTWLALYVAREFIETNPPFPLAVQKALGIPGRMVLYLDYDDDEPSVRQKMHAFGIDDNRVTYKASPATEDFAEQPWNRWLKFNRAGLSPFGLLIIDNVTAAMESMGLNDTLNKDVATWLRQFPKPIASKGITVLMLDHVTKANDGTNRYPIGGVQKLNQLDGCQFIVDVINPLVIGETGQVELRVSKDRMGRVRAVSSDYRQYDRSARSALFTLDSAGPDDVRATLELPEGRKHVSKLAREATDDRLLDFLVDHPRASFRALLDNINRDGPTLRQSIKRLEKAGKIKVEPGPRGAHLHSLV